MAKNNKGNYVKGGIIGMVAGVIAGLLFAPKSGKETRRAIKAGATKAAGEVEKDLKKLYRELSERVDQAEKKAAKLSGRAKKELSQLIEETEGLQSKMKQYITNLRAGEAINEKELRKTLEQARKTISNFIKRIT